MSNVGDSKQLQMGETTLRRTVTIAGDFWEVWSSTHPFIREDLTTNMGDATAPLTEMAGRVERHEQNYGINPWYGYES
jgi:hypothetical protein